MSKKENSKINIEDFLYEDDEIEIDTDRSLFDKFIIYFMYTLIISLIIFSILVVAFSSFEDHLFLILAGLLNSIFILIIIINNIIPLNIYLIYFYNLIIIGLIISSTILTILYLQTDPEEFYQILAIVLIILDSLLIFWIIIFFSYSYYLDKKNQYNYISPKPDIYE